MGLRVCTNPDLALLALQSERNTEENESAAYTEIGLLQKGQITSDSLG